MAFNYDITSCSRCDRSYEGSVDYLRKQGTFHTCFDGEEHCEGGCCPVKGFHDCDGWDPDSGCIAMDIGGVVPVDRPHTCTTGIKRCDRCCQCDERVQELINQNPATPDSAYVWRQRAYCHVCHHQADYKQAHRDGAVIQCAQCGVQWTMEVNQIDREGNLHTVHYRSVFTGEYQGYVLGGWTMCDHQGTPHNMDVADLSRRLKEILDKESSADPNHGRLIRTKKEGKS